MTQLVPRYTITKGSLGGKKFLFNPQGYSDADVVQYNGLQSAGISYPIPVYAGGDTRKVSFDLYLNDRVQSGITKSWISHLERYLPRKGRRYQFDSPPSLVFAFGTFVVDCHLESLTRNVTQFAPNLTPIEATLSIVLDVIQ